MKKIRLSTILLLMLTVLCSMLILASCSGGSNNTGNTPPTPTKLSAPTVVLSDDTATWNADVSADKFEISIDGSLSYIENSVTSKKLTDGQTFKIRSIGDGTNYTNSDWSNAVTYVKPISKYTVTWKNVDTVLETDADIQEGTIPTYDGAEPTKVADEQYSYQFAGWTPEITEATGDVTYNAVFNSTLRKYTVTWKNGDAILETDEDVDYGTLPVYNGVEPTKANDTENRYSFIGWSPEVDVVVGDIVYSAIFGSSPLTCTVTWKNGDTILETDENVAYGATPTYDGTTPTKDADAQYTYTFSGWSPEPSVVTTDITYVAQFESTINKYTVTWKNGDEILETDTDIEYGTLPSYDGIEPTKSATAQYSYTFKGWTPIISSVTGDVTYVAEFNQTVNKYTVTFYDESGTRVLDTVTVNYGEKAVYSKSAPVKNATESHTFIFDKWVTAQGGSISDNLENVVANRAVYASFKAFVRNVSVYIVSNNIDYGTVSVSVIDNVPYGSVITVNENVITINEETVSAVANAKSAQYTYSFVNWTTDSTVGNDTIITANFNRNINKYTVTWKNGDTTLETDENVSYGTTPVYNGQIPSKTTDNENIYTFIGWSPAVSSVTGDVTYYAEFTSVANKHTVIFYEEDGVTELGRTVVSHGDAAIYPNELPTKENTAQNTYAFEKWVTEIGGTVEATLTNITADTTVYAKYSESVREYTVTFVDWDGTILKTETVPYGSSATTPGDPERDGYRFDAWDKAFINIIDDTTVTAKYVKQFVVAFLDYDNSVIDTQLIDYNGNAIAPENPERNNYRFTGWNTTFGNVVSDLTVKAEYIRQYIVTFFDTDGTVLKEITVDSGAAAIPPNEPSKTGYDFIGWDKEYTNITQDTSITAQYTIKTYTVTFIMPDGTVIDEQTVEHGFSAISPEYPEFYLSGSGDSTVVCGFTKWNNSFDSVSSDLTIKAIYDSVYTTPVIIVEFSDERNGNANLYIYNDDSMMLNAIEFTINYKTSVGNISINSATINSASPLWVEDSSGNNNNQYVINNNESVFTFAWSDANGKQFDWCSKVITFNFATDGATVGETTFVIESCSAIVSEANGENLEKAIPVVVYR